MEREREMATAHEKISSLTEDLIASQGKVWMEAAPLLAVSPQRDHALLEEEKLLLEERVKELILQLEVVQVKSRVSGLPL